MITQFVSHSLQRRRELGRINWLAALSEQPETETREAPTLKIDRLSRAGFLSPTARKRAGLIQWGAVAGGLLLGAAASFKMPFFFALPVGAYLGALGWLVYLKAATAKAERKDLLELPIILESLILLVESGLGLLPALEKTVEKQETNPSFVRYLFQLVYHLSAQGLPFSEALKTASGLCGDNRTLRHILLHLDISGRDGGALVPSLRSLAQYAHSEWRLSVETRVRRLENLVVFPVFGAVIGLIMLTASVPLVPLLDLKEKLDERSIEVRAE
jgi:type II secretory pathway component PulF